MYKVIRDFIFLAISIDVVVKCRPLNQSILIEQYGYSTDSFQILSGQTLKTLAAHTGSVFCMALLTDGTLASGSFDKTIRVWDLNSGQSIKTLTGHTNSVESLAVLLNGSLASGSYPEIRVWDVNNGQTIKTLTGHANTVFSLAVFLDGTLARGSITIWF